MPYSPQQLSDLEDIRNLKSRYFRGIDTADLELIRPLFTQDVSVDYRGGSYRVAFSGREEMIEFIANSFHSGVLAMHHGHMPEITFSGDDAAEGIWYLEDQFIDLDRGLTTAGTAIYKDRYVRRSDGWKIAHTEYDRITEVVRPVREDEQITVHYLAQHGRKPEQRGDISHLIRWEG